MKAIVRREYGPPEVLEYEEVEKPEQKLLINGASGGVGTFAAEIAKSMGADVTGVCSTKNVAMVRSIGADRVIDARGKVIVTVSAEP